jgi:hypothetical protein
MRDISIEIIVQIYFYLSNIVSFIFLRNVFGPVFAQAEVLLRDYPAMLRRTRRLGWR